LYSLRYDTLRKRLVLPFALLGLFVSALLSGVTLWLVVDIEKYAVERLLQVEMESFRSRRARNPAALPPSATLIHGDFLPSPDFPSIVPPQSGEQRFQRLQITGRHYTVLVEDIAGRPYALLYDRTVREAGIVALAWTLAFGTILMGGLSTLIGLALAGQVVRPIRRLLTELTEKSSAIDAAPGGPVSFSAASYPDNEIGQLVRALDRFALRLHGFIQRESHFASDVSHELRTPVAVIRGAAEVLVESGSAPAPIHERLRTILRQSVRMSEILEAMLLLAQEHGASGDPACSLAEVVEEAVADCMPSLLGRPVELAVDICDRPILPVERSLAYVVVSNLLRNACAHTREGNITVRLMGDCFEIVDTGIGIAEHRFPEIFDRHVKGEESAGSGLGLSIVARITKLIRWEIGIESRPGTGTHVTVRFAPARTAAVG
jgi:signal transduction histidine kinase